MIFICIFTSALDGWSFEWELRGWSLSVLRGTLQLLMWKTINQQALVRGTIAAMKLDISPFFGVHFNCLAGG